jgi:hypothetical protein
VFDATNKEFPLITEVHLKSGVRTMCLLDGKIQGFGDTLCCGENDGWTELIRLDSYEIRISKKFEKMGHIYQIQPTSINSELCICSYTGVHFLKLHYEKKNDTMSLHESTVNYLTSNFINKVLEFAPGRFLASVWDANKYLIIDHE